MKRIFGRFSCPCPDGRPVVSVGMFDGVHLGHRAVLEELCRMGERLSAPSLVVTFDVHPRSVLSSSSAPAMITSLEHRLRLFDELGISCSHILTFSRELSEVSAESFICEFLVGMLGVCGVVLGHDTHFGRGRDGGRDMAQFFGKKMGFEVIEVPPVMIDGEVVSSTAIRSAVAGCDLDRAGSMLGRPVSVLGTVIRGQGLGRKLGFPTINLDPHHELRPPKGVYITSTRCGDSVFPSITNIGHRPTVNSDSPQDVLVETHLLGHSVNLYGQKVEVMFERKIRDERKFSGHSELSERVMCDIAEAKIYFGIS